MAIITKEKASGKDEFTELFFSTMTTGLSDVLKTAKESHNFYFNLGIEDELAQAIGRFIEDPLSIISEHHNRQIAIISNLLEHGVENFINNHKDLIKGAYKTNESEDELYYSFVLKDDTLKTRKIFFDFLNEYDRKPISKHFPLFFEFVPQKREKYIRKFKLIHLNAHEKSPK